MKKVLLLPPVDNSSQYRSVQAQILSKQYELIDNSKYSNTLSLIKLINLSNDTILIFDWFHMYYSHPYSYIKTFAKCIIFFLILWLLRIKKVFYYVNLHNVKPHNSGWKNLDYYMHAIVLRKSKFIRVFSKYNSKVVEKYYKIPKSKIHVLYEAPKLINAKPKKNHSLSNFSVRLLIIGQIRRYKHIIEALIELSDLLRDTKINLRIVGNIYDDICFQEIKDYIDSNMFDNVDLVPQYLTDQQFNQEIYNSDFVIVNSTQNYNSGVLTKCIMLNKPCIIRSQFGNIERMDKNKYFLINNGDLLETVKRSISKKNSIPRTLYNKRLKDDFDLLELMGYYHEA
jgi:hypothetical protein